MEVVCMSPVRPTSASHRRECQQEASPHVLLRHCVATKRAGLDQVGNETPGSVPFRVCSLVCDGACPCAGACTNVEMCVCVFMYAHFCLLVRSRALAHSCTRTLALVPRALAHSHTCARTCALARVRTCTRQRAHLCLGTRALAHLRTCALVILMQ